MTTFEIEIRSGSYTETIYVSAYSEAQALLKARAYARRTLSSTTYRFACFITANH